MLILLTFYPDNLEIFTHRDVDTVLKRIDGSHNIWLRCIHFRDRTGTAKIIKHFGLNSSRVNMIFNHSPVGIDEDVEPTFRTQDWHTEKAISKTITLVKIKTKKLHK